MQANNVPAPAGQNKEKEISGAGIIALLGVTIAVISGTYMRVSYIRASHATVAPPPTRLVASSHSIIGEAPIFRGNQNAGYTLVEFGDYQCPPCKRAHSEVLKLLARHDGKVRVVFKHFPLTKIHPEAMSAAIYAEAARRQGKFWEMHDALYEHQDNLSNENIRAIIRNLQLNPDRLAKDHSFAELNVISDAHQASQLKLSAAPTFILCRPDGSVFQLQSLAQVDMLITD